MEEYNLSPFHNQTDSLANISVTPLMIEHLRATKPWVKFIAITMFVVSGFMVLAGLIMMFMPTPMGTRGGGFGVMIGILYIVFSGLYIVPAYLLLQYASSINDLLQGGGDVAMEAALGSQKSFWRFVGILTLVVIALYAVIFAVAIFGAATMFR